MRSSDEKIPRCIGVIMDGNRRYAKAKGLPGMEGHRLGYLKAKKAADWCKEVGVKYMVLYAFSTENWNRTPKEVSYLIRLFKTLLLREAEEFRKEGGAIRFIGEIDRFGADFVAEVRKIEAGNPLTPSITIVIALSYGGRSEIVSAVNALIASGKTAPVTEEEFERQLSTASTPDPDLIIRTGGEKRLSNFLPWQSVYSELFFTDTHWPAFTQEEFTSILAEYGARERRIGR